MMPQNQSNIPGVYKPTAGAPRALEVGVQLHEEEYIPIPTDSLLELFKLGFTKESLADFMGVTDENDKSLNEAFNTILGRLEKGDAPGGLVGYRFPGTVVSTAKDRKEGVGTGGEYVGALKQQLYDLRQNPPFPPVSSKQEDGYTNYRFEAYDEAQVKQVNDWLKKIKSLQNLQKSVPDTFNIYANPFGEEETKSWKEQLINSVLHEPLHSIFHHEEKESSKLRGSHWDTQKYWDKGYTQDEYMDFTNKMKNNILENMSEEELAATIYKLLYNNGQGK